jgi:hypothetical protein
MKKDKKSLPIFMNRVLFPFSFCKPKREEKKTCKDQENKGGIYHAGRRSRLQ